ncbi:MAG: hypothetical protein K6E29_09330 [Cyanobacteria bacterium RUI128]|nr:hypothetical protein [Cyanobacteria bacterium RUI128]
MSAMYQIRLSQDLQEIVRYLKEDCKLDLNTRVRSLFMQLYAEEKTKRQIA